MTMAEHVASLPMADIDAGLPIDAPSGTEGLARRLRIAARALARHGMVRAEGECSARLDAGTFLMTPDMPLGLLTTRTQLVAVPFAGPIPAEAPVHAELHRAIYLARPETGAILRAMPPHASTPAAPSPSLDEPAAVLEHLDAGMLALLGKHGVLAAGRSIDAALARLWQWEEAARLALPGTQIAPADVEEPDERAVGRIWQFCTSGDEEAARAVSTETVSPPVLSDFDYWQSPGHLLRRCTQRAHDIFHEVLAEKITVTRQQFVVLWAIRDNPEASQQRLSEVTGWDRNTMAGMLARLQEQSLIERRRDERDARLYRIHLTPAGLAMLEDMVPELLEVRRRVLEPLPPELREVFVDCARQMLGLPSIAS
ncbi:class II aldolase/adducin family protein [Novosphingobium sp. KA1]|uniref:class II aldolase/adducin family protein n=1 Tax=Novosphingobium sp. (strain KA1) TaxID=164608 RepID=UPI001A8FDD6B|nr:class II aldolase/adducin family protein [Novosphingobium sp. KA1]